MDDQTILVIFFVVMLTVGWLIDRIGDKTVDWGNSAVSEKNTARIVAGKSKTEPRHLLKLSLAAAAVLILAWALGN